MKFGIVDGQEFKGQIKNIISQNVSADDLVYYGSNANNNVLDHSPGNHTINTNGNASFDAGTKKFGIASFSFDGDGDYLDIADSADWDIIGNSSEDWTIDLWVKHDGAITSNMSYVMQYDDDDNYWGLQINASGLRFNGKSGGVTFGTGSAGTISDNDWHHLAFCKVGTDWGVYLDGTQVLYVSESTTDTFAGSLYVGAFEGTLEYMSGNLDEVRIQNSNPFSATPVVGLTDTITVPTDEHTQDVDTKLLLHFNNPIADYSDKNHVATLNGNVAVSTTKQIFGSASCLFDGAGDYLSFPDSADWDVVNLNSDNWTLECWINPTSIPATQELFGQYQDANNYWQFYLTASLKVAFFVYGSGSTQVSVQSPTSSISTGVWQHVAMVKKGNEYGIYVDGVQLGYTTTSNTASFASPLYVGTWDTTTQYYNGYIDELKIQNSNSLNGNPNSSNGDNIIVPVNPYVADANTNLLLHFDNAAWKKANSTNAPMGIAIDANTILVEGIYETTGLTANRYYFMDANGDLTTTVNDYKVGWAMTTTKLLVDIELINDTAGYVAAAP